MSFPLCLKIIHFVRMLSCLSSVFSFYSCYAFAVPNTDWIQYNLPLQSLRQKGKGKGKRKSKRRGKGKGREKGSQTSELPAVSIVFIVLPENWIGIFEVTLRWPYPYTILYVSNAEVETCQRIWVLAQAYWKNSFTVILTVFYFWSRRSKPCKCLTLQISIKCLQVGSLM